MGCDSRVGSEVTGGAWCGVGGGTAGTAGTCATGREVSAAVVSRAEGSAPMLAAPARAATPAHGPKAASVDIPDGWTAIKAPNLGTFYRATKPDAPPYVEIGQKVTADTEICLIEVMKLFTPVRAGIAGIVRKVLSEDAQLVEYDQPLFLIEPAA